VPPGTVVPGEHAALSALLASEGFVAADEEAAELLARAGGDPGVLRALVDRRLAGEPLAWIIGSTVFCGLALRVDPHVYVPRWQSEALARRAAERLPDEGVAVDLCTGAGAVAAVLTRERPGATVLATDIDPRAVACARSNRVDALCGDLFDPLPASVAGRLDVVVGVVPYVPTGALSHLAHGTLDVESPRSYHGGPDGTDMLRTVVRVAPRWLRPGGSLLLELGGDQADLLGDALGSGGFAVTEVLVDEDGDVRGVVARYDGVPHPG
jgi:release factor glutamine methyltransferase